MEYPTYNPYNPYAPYPSYYDSQKPHNPSQAAILRLVGSILLALAIFVSCCILAVTFARNYYPGDTYVPDSFMARVSNFDSDYLSEDQAMQFIGLEWMTQVWDDLIESGSLDGTYVVYAYKQPDWSSWEFDMEEEDLETIDMQVRVFSKAKLDAWMRGQFGQQDSAPAPEEP